MPITPETARTLVNFFSLEPSLLLKIFSYRDIVTEIEWELDLDNLVDELDTTAPNAPDNSDALDEEYVYVDDVLAEQLVFHCTQNETYMVTLYPEGYDVVIEIYPDDDVDAAKKIIIAPNGKIHLPTGQAELSTEEKQIVSSTIAPLADYFFASLHNYFLQLEKSAFNN